MAGTGMTLSDLNRLNREFWERERTNMEARMSDAIILQAALELLKSDTERGLPLCWQKPFELVLAEGEKLNRLALSLRGKAAGEVKKADALQQLIVEVVRERPDITTWQLLDLLRRRSWVPPIEGIDEETICFRTHRGTGEAKISGLKDRLSRAKKSLRSR